MTPAENAAGAAEVIRALNHQTRAAGDDIEITDVYDLVAELALLTSRLPQLLGQLDGLVERLVEDDQVLVVDGPHTGDAPAAAAVAGHWLIAGAHAADALAHALDATQQTLAHAATARPPIDH